jgi:hypothetical protein
MPAKSKKKVQPPPVQGGPAVKPVSAPPVQERPAVEPVSAPPMQLAPTIEASAGQEEEKESANTDGDSRAEQAMLKQEVDTLLGKQDLSILKKLNTILQTWKHFAPPDYHPEETESDTAIIIQKTKKTIAVCASRDEELIKLFQDLGRFEKIWWRNISQSFDVKKTEKYKIYYDKMLLEMGTSIAQAKMNNDLARILCEAASFARKYAGVWKKNIPLPIAFSFFEEAKDILSSVSEISMEIQKKTYSASMAVFMQTMFKELNTCLIKFRSHIPTFTSKQIKPLRTHCIEEIDQLQKNMAPFFSAELQPASNTILSAFIKSIFALSRPEGESPQATAQAPYAKRNAGKGKVKERLQQKLKQQASESRENRALFALEKDASDALKKIQAALELASQLEEKITTAVSYNQREVTEAFFRLLPILEMYETIAASDIAHAHIQKGFYGLLHIALFFVKFFLKTGMKKIAYFLEIEIDLQKWYWVYFQKHLHAVAEISKKARQVEEEVGRANANFDALSQEWLAEQYEVHKKLCEQASAIDTESMAAWSDPVQEKCVAPLCLTYQAEQAMPTMPESGQAVESVFESQVYMEVFPFLKAGQYANAGIYCQKILSDAVDEEDTGRIWDCHITFVEIGLLELKRELQKKLTCLSFPNLVSVHRAVMQSYHAAWAVLNGGRKEKVTLFESQKMIDVMEVLFSHISEVTKHIEHKKNLLQARLFALELGRLKTKAKWGAEWKQGKAPEALSKKAQERIALDEMISSPAVQDFMRYLQNFGKEQDYMVQELERCRAGLGKKPRSDSSKAAENGPGFFNAQFAFPAQQKEVPPRDFSFFLPSAIKELMMTFVEADAKGEAGECIALSGGALLHTLLPDAYPIPLDIDLSTNVTSDKCSKKLAGSRIISPPFSIEVEGQILSMAQFSKTKQWAEIAYCPNLPLDDGNPPQNVCRALVVHAQKKADFTVNGIYLLYTKAGGFCLFDAAHHKILKTQEEFEAIPEIKNKILRITGSLERIEENPILILRALKMIWGKGYHLEKNGELQKWIQVNGARVLRSVLHGDVSPEKEGKRAHMLHYFKTKLEPFLKQMQCHDPEKYRNAEALLKTLHLSQVVTRDGLEEEKPASAGELSALGRLSFRVMTGGDAAPPACFASSPS